MAWFTLAGWLIAVPITLIGGFAWGWHVFARTPTLAAMESTLFFSWIGALVGFVVGLVVEWTRPRRALRMLEHRDTRN